MNVSVDKCSGDGCPCKLRKKKPAEILSEFGVTMQEAFRNVKFKAPVLMIPPHQLENPIVRDLKRELKIMLEEEERIRDR